MFIMAAPKILLPELTPSNVKGRISSLNALKNLFNNSSLIYLKYQIPYLWGFLPTSIIIIKNYFFDITALRINASIPAGISPVVNNSFKLIPKSGMCLTNCGNNDIPIPKESDNPKISKFL